MAWQELLGFIAGALIAVAFIPQVYRLWRLKSAREISLVFTLLSLAGGVSWLIYGIGVRSPALITANSFNISLVIAMLIAKLKFGKS